MSLHLLKALRLVSSRDPKIPISKSQLFNMLKDYNAFKDSPVLSFAVRTFLNDGIWNNICEAFNDKERNVDNIEKLKSIIHTKYGFSRRIINSIFYSIEWGIEDWDNSRNPSDTSNNLYLMGVPIVGTSFDLVQNLINIGLEWNYEKNCLTGSLYGTLNCEFHLNESTKNYPVFNIKIKLPEGTSQQNAFRLLQDCRFVEIKRKETLNKFKGEINTFEVPVYNQITLTPLDNLNFMICFKDPWGARYFESNSALFQKNYLSTSD